LMPGVGNVSPVEGIVPQALEPRIFAGLYRAN